MDAAFGVAFSRLLNLHNLEPAALARALLIGTAAALPFLWFGGRALPRLPRRPPLVAVALLVPLASWLLVSGVPAGVFLLAVGLLVLITAGLDVLAGTTALDAEARFGIPILGKAQSGFAAGALLGALVGGALAQAGALWVMPWLVSALGATLAFAALRLPRLSPVERVAAPRAALPGLPFVMIGMAALLAYCAEGLMLSWSPMYLQREIGLSAGQAGTLGSAYYAAFGAGAALSSYLLHAWGARRALRLLSVTAAFGALVLVTAPTVTLAFGGMIVLGASIAGLMPTLLSWAARRGLGGSAAGYVTTFAYGGMVLEPLMVSLSGDSLRPVMLALPVLLLATGLVSLRVPSALPRAAPATVPVAGD